MSRTPLLLAVFHLIVSCSPEEVIPPSSTASPPNIILVLTDDQGYGDLGVHGNPHLRTPNLDRLYGESVRFTDFHVATTCAPTRAGILSGIHCNRAGAWHTVNGRSFLHPDYPTMADYAGNAGYRSAIFGKWHLGDNLPFRPSDRGFDEALIHGGGGVGQTPDAWNNDQFDDRYFHNGKLKPYEGYCTDVWFDAAFDFIDSMALQEQPFLLYLATNAPHSPHLAPQEYLDLYADNDSVNHAGFYAQITQLDQRMGDLEAKLAEMGLKDNTILIFLTDNGTASGATLDQEGYTTKGFNAGMRGKKGWEYEGGHRVPLFIRFPEHMDIPPTEHDELVSYLDILPTLTDLLDWDTSQIGTMDGTSLVELLKTGRQAALAERILITDTQRNERPVKWKNTSLMQGSWRLINAQELYDISEDPGQRHNIIDQHPERVAQLTEYYDRWWTQLEKDIDRDWRIIIGSPEDNPCLLTAHDWHSGQNPPWHQRHIRSATEDNGYWLLEAATAGRYKVSLYRWPPDLQLPMDQGTSEGDPVPGGSPYPAGSPISVRSATLSINDSLIHQPVSSASISVDFNTKLPAGPIKLRTTLIDADGIERGAYYVTMEYLEGDE